jgi:glycosyltransferase involved in cell wall biosynthesis
VFFFPSRTDTFGNVVLEAQACGVPGVVTDAGGPREAVRHGETGLICGSTGPFTLAVALSWLLRESSRRAQMGAAARRLALTRSWPLALEPLFDAWRTAVRSGRRTPVTADVADTGFGLATAGASR